MRKKLIRDCPTKGSKLIFERSFPVAQSDRHYSINS